METIVWIFIAAEGILTLAGFGLLFTRRKYAEQLRSSPEERVKAILGSSRKIVKATRLLFWASPIYLILIPLIISCTFGEKWFSYSLAVMALMYLMLLPVFVVRKWLLRNLSEPGEVGRKNNE